MQACKERERYVRKGKRGGHKQAILTSLMLVITIKKSTNNNNNTLRWLQTRILDVNKMDFDSPALHNLFTSC